MPPSSVADRASTLRSIPIFRELSDTSLQEVLECVTEFEVAKGHVLVQPGHPGEGLFVIEEGMAVVELPGRRIELSEGEFFGELALLDQNAVHTGRVSAATPLKGLAIRRDDFDRLLQNQPNMAISMLRVLARRLAASSRA